MNAIEAHLAALREAVEENYRRAIAPAEAERQSQLMVIEELGAKLLNSLAPTSHANDEAGANGSTSKVDTLLKALGPQFKSVAELATICGLSRDQVSAALTRPRVQEVLRHQGKAGSFKYARKRQDKTAKTSRGGVAKAIGFVLAKHPNGISRTELVDAVEKLTVSRAKAPRVAISSTISWMVTTGRARLDSATERLFVS